LRRHFLAGTFLVCMLLGGFSQSWARLKISPYLTAREAYNDNIFLDSSNEQEDFIATLGPGISLSWPSNYLKLDMDYGFEFLIFKDHPEENETSPNDTQRALLKAEILPERDFSIMVREDISRVTIDESRPVAQENQFVNKTTQYALLVNPSYRFRSIPTFEATLGYQFENITYSSSQGDDSSSNTFTLDLGKDLSPRFNISLNYEYKFFQADITEDYRQQNLSGGFSWKASPRLQLEGSVGATHLEFKDGVDHTFPNWLGKIEYQASKRVSLSMQYSQTFILSVDQGLYRARAVTGNLRYSGRVTLDLNGFATDHVYTSEDREDRSAGGGTVIGIPLTNFIKLNLQGNYAYSRFLPELEDVNRYALGGSLVYSRKVLTISLGYLYQISDSDFNINDYRNNIVYLQGGVKF
jgi:uncharacterized protein (PEP-CTERM system associated)